jgi:nitrogen fixation NifU-like protein
MEDFYREVIIDRHKHPLYKGTLETSDVSFEDENPLCGDQIRIDIKFDENENVVDAKFSGTGCAISTATADLLVEALIGKTFEEVNALTKEDILKMIGIELGPVRLKCALLPFKVVKAGLVEYQSKKK